MSVFVDTSALVAVISDEDERHAAAADLWRHLADGGELLVTTNYVMLEFCALVQRRFGMAVVQSAADGLAPALSVQWVTQPMHDAALTAFLTANRRSLSLVDCVSFLTMRERGLARAFTFDPHFAEQGFELIPPQDR